MDVLNIIIIFTFIVVADGMMNKVARKENGLILRKFFRRGKKLLSIIVIIWFLLGNIKMEKNKEYGI